MQKIKMYRRDPLIGDHDFFWERTHLLVNAVGEYVCGDRYAGSSLWNVYMNADLVTFPSTHEGWRSYPIIKALRLTTEGRCLHIMHVI